MHAREHCKLANYDMKFTCCSLFKLVSAVYVGLEPSTLYYYQCGDSSLKAMSDIYYFRTMPISGPQSYPGRIAIAGDLGLTYNTTTTVSHLTSNKPDLFLLIGDVTYANLYLTNGTGSDCYSCSFPQTPIHETYQPRWDYWGRYMEKLYKILSNSLRLMKMFYDIIFISSYATITE